MTKRAAYMLTAWLFSAASMVCFMAFCDEENPWALCSAFYAAALSLAYYQHAPDPA